MSGVEGVAAGSWDSFAEADVDANRWVCAGGAGVWRRAGVGWEKRHRMQAGCVRARNERRPVTDSWDVAGPGSRWMSLCGRTEDAILSDCMGCWVQEVKLFLAFIGGIKRLK